MLIRVWLKKDNLIIAEKFEDTPKDWDSMNPENRDEYLNELTDAFMNEHPNADFGDAEVILSE